MYMIIFVLHNPDLLEDILNAWDDTGVGGVTILPSTGLARIREKGFWRDDLPLFPSLEDFQSRIQNLNRTLMTIVDDDQMVDKIVAATQQVTGDLNLPNTGILSVLPVLRTYGLNRIPDSKD